MSGTTGLLLLLLSGRAAFIVCRSLNAPQDVGSLPRDGQTDGTDSLTATVTGVDRRQRPLLAKTRPFVLVDGRRRSLEEAFRDGHPDRLQCGLEVGGRLFLLELEKNHDLLPKPPNVFYYLPNGTGVSVMANPVTHCYYHGSVRGFPQSRVALSTCSGLRGIIALNATLSFELQPQEEQQHHHQQARKEEEEEGAGGESGGGGGDDEGGVHLLFSTSPLEDDAAGGCGVSHTAVPPIHSSTHTHRTKRDILSETKYIELVLVADHQEMKRFLSSCQDHLVSVLGVASTVAHELGHNLGMSHDTAERHCSCQNEPRLGGCIMEPSTGFMPGQLFSSCSAADLSVSLLHGGGMCLFNVPQPEHLLGGPRLNFGSFGLNQFKTCICDWFLFLSSDATSAPAVCFSSVNKKGNKYGNCGQLTNGSYIPCGNSDVHCGRIQCQGGRDRPLLGTNAEILTTRVHFNNSDLVCRGTFFHLGDDVSDPATVAHGTACGRGKACLNQKCQDVSVFGVDECRRKCNGHGVTARLFDLLAFSSRTPAMERVDGRNGEQVRPLRYHLNPQTDIPLTPPQKEVHDRPAPPTKPLPPDPALKPPPQQLVSRPAPPNKPLPPDPITPGQVSVPLKPLVPKKPRPPAMPSNPYLPPHPVYNSKPPPHGAVAPAAAGPNRRPPLPPLRPAVPLKVESSPPL
ncbi:disintegrin and metalloproteinase domain-containing protein 12-like [Neolamprologus brichardi]|uniref:disintegrin and metalloproteinase domain-containing protein 12-like n=1 Tax=Neolamprologus brichardi TaxID=32507 RepID=UPI001643B3BB|nr:disintegrin and metalloproteinase domain-containing protein 12-like [Neolamprologus brichardi]